MKKIIFTIILLYCFIIINAQNYNIVWQQCLGDETTTHYHTVAKTSDGFFLALGLNIDNGTTNYHGSSDIWLIRTDSLHIILWQKCFGGLGSEKLWNGVIDNGDGSYVITATLFGNANSGDVSCMTTPIGGYDIWLIQLRDTTVVSTNHIPYDAGMVSVYPNPANDYVVFELKKPLPVGNITISDITGRLVTTMALTGEKTVWQTGEIPTGVYLYRIKGATSVASGKLLIMN
ncbi:MAG TPA: T9SS type A sorting domain-containing protein [Lentimicrobium sp.]|jgi:hypothetical protein|nr:T9SS type A sorting domain-containing protein [Lentimicrobium sp.]